MFKPPTAIGPHGDAERIKKFALTGRFQHPSKPPKSTFCFELFGIRLQRRDIVAISIEAD